MGNIINQFGQVKVGFRSNQPIPSSSTVWNNIYSVYNADSVGSSSLKTSLYAVYNGESNANDSFGSNNGTAQGGLTYTAGKIGNAFNFNGTNAYASLSDNSLNINGAMSFSFWIKTSNTTDYTIILGNVQGARTPYGFQHGWMIWLSAGKIQSDYKSGTNISAGGTSVSSVANNTWNYVTVTYNPANPTTGDKIYINGVLDKTSSTLDASGSSSIHYTSPMKPCIGARNQNGTPSNFLSNGTSLDAVNIWTRELSASEITELYNSGNGAQYITNDFYKPTTNDALNTYNGTAQGGLTYGVGKVGTAFIGNGTNAYVNMGDVMDIGTSSWSYAMWFNPTTFTTQTIFGKTIAAGVRGRIFCQLDGDKLVVGFDADATNVIIVQTPILGLNLGTWYHVVVQIDRSDKLKIYVNNTLLSLTTTNGTNNLTPYSATNYNTNNPFRIGAYTSADNVSAFQFFNGKIDAFNVWNRVLTATEITELYNSGNGKQYPN